METRLKVEGMHCEGCVGRVRRVLEREEGVREAEVSLEDGEARVRPEGQGPDVDRLRSAVEGAGFSATLLG